MFISCRKSAILPIKQKIIICKYIARGESKEERYSLVLSKYILILKGFCFERSFNIVQSIFQIKPELSKFMSLPKIIR